MLRKPIAALAILSVLALSTIMLCYAMSPMLGGLYRGGWPIFLYYVLLYLTAVALPVTLGFNRRFGITLAMTVCFKFWFIFSAEATIQHGQAVLFEGGVPTVTGILAQTSICVAMVIFAIGLAGLVRQAARTIGAWGQLFDPEVWGTREIDTGDHRAGIRDPRSLL